MISCVKICLYKQTLYIILWPVIYSRSFLILSSVMFIDTISKHLLLSSRKAWLLITIFAIYSPFLLPSFFRREEKREKIITKVVVKRHAFLLDHLLSIMGKEGENEMEWSRGHDGQFQSYPVLYDHWLFITFFLIPPKKREEEKENEVAKPGLNHFFRKGLKFTVISL